jgi:hypothetical protein
MFFTVCICSMKKLLLCLAVVLACGSPAKAQETIDAYKASILAGRSTTPMRLDGVGENARFESITALWGDNANLYVADSTAIRRIELATSRVNTLSQTAGTGFHRRPSIGGYQYDYSGLYGLWGDGTSLYAGDAGSGKIQKIDLVSGGVQTVAEGLGLTWGLAARGSTLYVSSAQMGKIMQVDAATGVTSELAVTGTGSPHECFLGSGCIGYFVPGPRSAWSDGSSLYLTGYSGTVKKLDLASGAQSQLPPVPFTIGPITGAPGELFVAARSGPGLGRIRIETGGFTPIALPDVDVNVSSISALWADSGNLYMAQGPYLHAQVVRRIDLRTGTVTTIAGVDHIPEFVSVSDAADAANGVGPAARFRTLTDIWSDGTNLYVTDRGNLSIRKIEISTGAVTQVAGIPGTPGLQDGPSGVATFGAPAAVWGDGRSLYVVDQNSIRSITLSTGDVHTLAGGVTPGARDAVGLQAQFNSPQDLWGFNGFLYISDGSNRVVRQLNLGTMEVTTMAGAFGTPGADDGTRGSARFRYPGELWGSGSTLYVSDVDAIRKISLDSGIVRTLAILPATGGISGLWGKDGALYASANSNTGSASVTLYRISIDDGQLSELLHGLADTDTGLPISFPDVQGISGNAMELFIAGGSDNVVRRLTPDLAPALVNVEISNPGYRSRATTGGPATVSVGHARVGTTPGKVTVAGFATFALRQNGVLISEASVPVTPAFRSGRISVFAGGAVNTGIAIANPTSQPATITFYFTDVGGRNYGPGSFILAGGAQTARFLTEPPFNGTVPIDGTFTFTSSIPVSAVALRGYVNERSEFLMTTLPVIDLSRQLSTEPAIVAHVATGGGWTTELVLLNASEQTISGSLQFLGAAQGSIFPSNYTIAPRASQRLQFTHVASAAITGAIRILPQIGVTPSAVCIFSFMRNGVRVTEASGSDVPPASSFRLYADETPSASPGEAGSIRNGLAITNAGAAPVDVKVEIAGAEGQQRLPFAASLHVPAFGHLSLFIDEIPGTSFGTFAAPVRGGMVRVSSALPTISVVGIRGRYNERGDFLITSTPAVREGTVPDTQPLFIPHIVNGGGYKTQFVLFAATAQSVATDFRVTTQYFDQNGNPLFMLTR